MPQYSGDRRRMNGGADARTLRAELDRGTDMSASTINVAVIGAGSWGTTVAALAAVNTPTVLWARRRELADEINDAGVNPEYLPNFTLPDALRRHRLARRRRVARRRRRDGGAVARLPRRGGRSSSIDPAVGAGRVAVEGARAHDAQADERGHR